MKSHLQMRAQGVVFTLSPNIASTLSKLRLALSEKSAKYVII
jgi:hypothetical protein